MSRRCTLARLLIAASFAWSALGCSKVAEKIQEKITEKAIEKSIESQSGGTVKLDIASGKTVLKSQDGKQQTELGAGATIPAAFPKQVPIYPGATVDASTADNGRHPKFMVTFSTKDSSAKVTAYYKAELKGFKLENESHIEGFGDSLTFIDKTQSKLQVKLVMRPDDTSSHSMALFVESL